MIVYVHLRETSKKVNMTTGYQRNYDFDKEITGHIPYEPTYSYRVKPVRNPEREKPKWEDTITNRMLHWSYAPGQKEEVKKALAAGVPKAMILTYFYPEVTVEKMSSYRKKQ